MDIYIFIYILKYIFIYKKKNYLSLSHNIAHYALPLHREQSRRNLCPVCIYMLFGVVAVRYSFKVNVFVFRSPIKKRKEN